MRNICCVGAGHVGGPSMAVMALKAADTKITVVDTNVARITAWNSAELPVYEPGLEAIVKQCRGRNLFFSTDVRGAIKSADLIFVALNAPTKYYGHGAGRASDLRFIEAAARTIAEVSDTPKIVVEKSTIPAHTAETIRDILRAGAAAPEHQVLSNPDFFSEGTAIADLLAPDRVLIGGEHTPGGDQAVEVLAGVYDQWVPRERIITTNLWSAELSKLAASAFLAQRISSINSISALCEATGADIDEIAVAIGSDSRIGPKFLQASVGFGGACFQKDLLSLVYMCEHYGLARVAAYWEAVVDVNDWQKQRFGEKIVKALFNTVAGKKIAVFGFAFKKNTNDSRESPAINVVRDLLAEKANVVVYDPQIPERQIITEVLGPGSESEQLTVAVSPYQAAEDAHALVIVTDWDEFAGLDYEKIYARMLKPAFVFDGRNLLPPGTLRDIGFHVHGIGK